MSKRLFLGLAITALVLFVFLGNSASAQTVTIDGLLKQIQALQEQIKVLQNQQKLQQTPPPTFGQSVADFNKNLFFGLRQNSDVVDVQEFLTDQGYYAGPITGNFGLLTLQAVRKFQQTQGINPTGYWGPLTRAAANQIMRKIVGIICKSEESCPGDVLPVLKLSITTDSDLRATVGTYFIARFTVTGGSGNYDIDVDDSANENSGLRFTRTYCPPTPEGVACAQLVSPDSMTLYGTPKNAGVYPFGIYARDNSKTGGYGKERFTLVIKGADKYSPPVISGVKGPTTLKAGEVGIWTVNASNPQGGNLSYRVVWGDEGTIAGKEGLMAPQAVPFSQTATFSHVYQYPGVYSPIFYVVNDRGQEAKTSISVNVTGTTQPSITVTSPNGGENIPLGQSNKISWSFSGDISQVRYIALWLFRNDQQIGWVTPQFGTVGPTANSYIWDGYYTDSASQTRKMPDTGNGYKILAIAYGTLDKEIARDQSDAPFSIVSASSATINSFTSNISTDGGYDFWWNTTGGDWVEFRVGCQSGLTITTHEGSFLCGDIDRRVANAGSIHLHFVNNSGSNLSVNATLDVIKSGTVAATKGIVINLLPTTQPSITVLSPNGGENIPLGQSNKISWSFSGDISQVRYIALWLFRNDQQIGWVTPQFGTVGPTANSYIWDGYYTDSASQTRKMPDTGNGYKILAIAYGTLDKEIARDQSDAPFSIVAGTQTSTIPSPIAHWKFDEGAGTTASDSSGNGNTGTLVSGPLWVTGKSGRALQFDKIDDMVSVNAPTSFDNLPQVTISAWINPKSTGEGALGRIVDKSDTTSPDRGWIFYLTGTNQLSFMVDFTSTNLSKRSSALTLNQWQHVAVTWDGTSSASGARLYVNGNEVTYATNQSGSGTRVLDDVANLYIGNNKSGARTFDGDIDDVRVFNRALTPQEVNQVMQVGAGAYDSERDRKLAEIQNELLKLNASIQLFFQNR